jgi:hypothetical protein
MLVVSFSIVLNRDFDCAVILDRVVGWYPYSGVSEFEVRSLCRSLWSVSEFKVGVVVGVIIKLYTQSWSRFPFCRTKPHKY